MTRKVLTYISSHPLQLRKFNPRKLDRQLRTLLIKLDEECYKVAFAIRNIVNLTEAFQMEQAVKLQNGPFAKIRQQHLETMIQVPKVSQPSPTAIIRKPLVSSDEAAASTQVGPWSRRIMLSLGECTQHSN